jgi:hypothetical protein
MIKLYQLGKGVYNEYCRTVKGNLYTPQMIVQRKLIRNILLSNFNSYIGFNQRVYIYGNLNIYVEGNTIVKIKNYKNNNCKWYPENKSEYNKLNNILGITLYNKLYKEMQQMFSKKIL